MEKGSPAKILIVDDAPENIDVLGAILAEYKRIVALDGEHALQKALSDNPPDLILLDIMMPHLDGYEVCRRLKAVEKTRDIPIIFITGKGAVEDETAGFEAGAVDYITKPISAPIVKARVKTHLELKQAREDLKRQNQELREAAHLREDMEQIARHDLKNPLNAIIGFPQLILETETVSERAAKYLHIIEESGYRILKMINLSVDLFKMERGLYHFEPNPVNLLPILKKITFEMDTFAEQKEVAIEILSDQRPAAEDEIFLIQGEDLLCYAMFMNLVKNALEASPRNAVVSISLSKEPPNALIRIQNAGAVPEPIRDRFFDKFATYGKQKAGTGLGTYSAKLMATIHGGRIAMETSEEAGTTITVSLPEANAYSIMHKH